VNYDNINGSANSQIQDKKITESLMIQLFILC